MGFKWGEADAARTQRRVRCRGYAHAMNMRAAEAIVSNAPKAMKIFPISEVWSQVELRCCGHAPARPRRGLAEAIATVGVAGGGCFLQGAIESLS